MSGFRDTFTKGEKENILGYDDSASLYFGGCVLLCINIAWTYMFISRVIWPKRSVKEETILNGKNQHCCSCTFCNTAIQKKKCQATSWRRRLFSFSIIFQFLALSLLWFLFFKVVIILKNSSQLQMFDPFEILELSSSASISDVRKAYRILSRKHHPDNNLNDPSSAARFILISKAYQALTDEVAKTNYAKYGNPDGPGALKIGIGLPHFLVDEQYQLFILLFFFIILLVIIPAIFIVYYQRQRRYVPNGVYVETVQLIAYYLKEGTRAKVLPEILAASAESRELTSLHSTDNVEMKSIIAEIEEASNKKLFGNAPLIVRNHLLILAHMQRLHHLLSPRLQEDLNKLLSVSEGITQCMLEFAFFNNWPLTVQSVVEFRRRLIQAIQLKGGSPLMQIPHITDTCIKNCSKGRKPMKDFKSFILKDITERKGILSMSPDKIEDIACFCRHVPLITLSATAAVVDETDISEGDIITVTVTLERENLKNGETAGIVHAPLHPVLKEEQWWLFLSDKSTGSMITFTRCYSQNKVSVETMQFPAPKKGKWAYTLLAMSDCYIGLDVIIDLNIQVLSPNDVRREIAIHPDDEALDHAPTLFQQMLGQGITIDDSSDEEDPEHPSMIVDNSFNPDNESSSESNEDSENS